MTMHNPPYPGELIAETLDELGIGIRELARALHIAPSTVHRLVHGISVITPAMAVKLSVVLGGSPKFWLNLQDNYSLSVVSHQIDTSELSRLVVA
jgi:addiction module HigA family antidote